MDRRNPIQVADRLFQVMELLASNRRMGLTEISIALELNKSTVHRILNSLMYMGYVRQSEEYGKYESTLKIVDIADKIMRNRDILSLVRPHLRALMEVSKETVHLVERDGVEAVYIDKVESYLNSIQMVSHIGSRTPLYCSAVGKAMAADMSEADRKEMWNSSHIIKKTPYTITAYEEFEKNLEEIRTRGYALDNEENEMGVRCIAVSLKGYLGGYEYALSISAPVNRMDNKRIKELSEYVLKTKEDIMAKL